MKRAAVLSMLLLASVAAGPSSQPTTQPGDAYPALQKRLAELNSLVQSLKDQVAKLNQQNEDLQQKLDAANAVIAQNDAKRTKTTGRDAAPQPVAVGWQGVIGKARVVKVRLDGCILELIADENRSGGIVYLSLDGADEWHGKEWADDQLVQDTTPIYVKGRTHIDTDVFLLAEPVSRKNKPVGPSSGKGRR